MQIYKEKQFLVFDFEDGRRCRYDFSEKVSYGFNGKIVKDIKSQLSGLSINDLMDCCKDKNYVNFLKFIQNRSRPRISNIGTMLERVSRYSNLEQFFSAGLNSISEDVNCYSISNVPKSLIKIAKEKNICLSKSLIYNYSENIDGYYYVLSNDYMSLTLSDLITLLIRIPYVSQLSYFNILVKTYGYNSKHLIKYIDELKTFEAIDDVSFMIRELYDYVTMMSSISNNYEKYPRHFLSTHKIACRNYNRLKKEFPEDFYKKRINIDYEFTYKDYCFIYPKSTEEIKKEAVAQNNCVASYIDRVLDGKCHILFLRKKDDPDKSLVTLEVVDDRVVQAKRKFNYPASKEDMEAIKAWEEYYKKDKKGKAA